MDYKQAGVDIQAAEQALDKIKKMVKSTFSPQVGEQWGNFGGLYKIDENRYLVASADGVGTKLKIAMDMNIHDTVGEDLVNHCVNDILTLGARPLFFMDYLATGKLNQQCFVDIIKGITNGCVNNHCALIGGETAEMPGFYSPGEYDLAGFIVGEVNSSKILGSSKIKFGDIVLGLSSHGLHTNGYSLVRKIFSDHHISWNQTFPGLKGSLGENLLKVHKTYYPLLKSLLDSDSLHGLAHITGGGIEGNLSRIIPSGLQAEIEVNWEIPPLFQLIEKIGEINKNEMFKVFNMGIGMIVIAGEDKQTEILKHLTDHRGEVFKLGIIKSGRKKVELHL